LIRGLEAFAQAVGGLPQRNVFDNTKSAVARRWRDEETKEPRWRLQQRLGSFLASVGVHAEPTAPYSGNQKGSVENLVGFVKTSFFQCRQFRNRADLERQLGEWLRWVNYERKCDATKEIPSERLSRERDLLRPLKEPSLGYGLVFTAVVGTDGLVRHDRIRYSAPAAWIGQTITVRRHREKVVLWHNDQSVEHPRVPANGKYSLLPEHMDAYLKKPRGKVMMQRQILVDLDAVVAELFTELVHRRENTWRVKDLPALWRCFEKVGPEGLVEAIAVCVAEKRYGAEYVEAELQRLGMAP
jgi:hypothetical protein